MWGEDISSKEKRIFYLSPILLFMSFMAYPPQIFCPLSLSRFSLKLLVFEHHGEKEKERMKR